MRRMSPQLKTGSSGRFSQVNPVHVVIAIATLAGTGLLTYLLWSIPISYYVIGTGPLPANTQGAAIALPSFVGPAFYALVGILIGVLLSIGSFVLINILRGVKDSKSRSGLPGNE